MAEYIDREAVVDAVTDIYYDTPGINLTAEKFEAAINGIPAADVAPAVNGHWVSLTDCSNAGVYCSNCHKKVYKEDYASCNRKNKLRSNYCPNCGADMREKED